MLIICYIFAINNKQKNMNKNMKDCNICKHSKNYRCIHPSFDSEKGIISCSSPDYDLFEPTLCSECGIELDDFMDIKYEMCVECCDKLDILNWKILLK